jgi:FkbM family methyltransferase
MEYVDIHGSTAEFECEPTIASHWVSRDILAGQTYPDLGFANPVRTIVDVGANCGAASVYFAQRHPDAMVHSLEPGSRQRAVLERNVASYSNVRVHPIGLHAVDQLLPLYFGDGDSGMSSVIRSEWNTEEHEVVTLRNAATWAAENAITAIDLLKVDVEGVEVEVLEAMSTYVPTVKVLYVEYDSRAARRSIAKLLEPTHELFIGKLFLDQGEITYIRRDLAEAPSATAWLQSISLQ